MGLKLLWSDNAVEDLAVIFDYYKFVASSKVSKSIIRQIVNRTKNLENFPIIGTKEPLLSHKSKDYRYLTVNNYKIVYFKTENEVIISTIFDCRQNPKIIT